MPFKKGNIPWNKNKKGLQEAWNKGKKSSKETIEKLKKSLIGKIFSSGWKHTQSAKDKNRIAHLGKKCSKETREKMSKAHKGHVGYTKGMKFTNETKRKMSESHKGEKCNWWQGGKSFEEYSVDWVVTLKRSIRERDHYTCQLCNKEQGDEALSVHHIDYNKKNCNPDNLISLCRSCHSKTNNNRKDWIDYFINNKH